MDKTIFLGILRKDNVQHLTFFPTFVINIVKCFKRNPYEQNNENSDHVVTVADSDVLQHADSQCR
jgi:hypothetical protein